MGCFPHFTNAEGRHGKGKKQGFAGVPSPMPKPCVAAQGTEPGAVRPSPHHLFLDTVGWALRSGCERRGCGGVLLQDD